MAHCKGIAVLARLKWVQQHHGAEGSARLLEALPIGTRETVERHVLPHGWVPMLHFVEDACVQCGLCRSTCPEKVIRLEPRLETPRNAEQSWKRR